MPMLSPGTGLSRCGEYGLARQREGAEGQVRGTRHLEARAVQADALAVDAAVVAQHLEHRVAGRQVFVDRVGAPQRQRPAALAQHEQAGGVVDLAVHQHHAGDRGVAEGAAGLQRGVRADLLEDVGRGVEQHAVGARVTLHEDRRLSARPGAHRAGTNARAVAAVAVPLRETAAGGRTEDRDAHGMQTKRPPRAVSRAAARRRSLSERRRTS
jgi:hypothetical protein